MSHEPSDGPADGVPPGEDRLPVSRPSPSGMMARWRRGRGPGRGAGYAYLLTVQDDLRLAAATGAAAIALMAVGAIACALLPVPHRPSATAVLPGAAALGVLSLSLLAGVRRAPPAIALAVADLAAVVLVGWLVSRTGEAHSVLAALYLLPLLHAAAFQSTAPFAAVATGTLIAFVAPALYGAGGAALTAMAVLVAPPVLAGAAAVHVTRGGLRAIRMRMLESDDVEVVQEVSRAHGARPEPLSNLCNYRAFWLGLEAEISRAHRYDESFSLVLIDLGPCTERAGAKPPQPLAEVLVSSLRDSDVCCRLSGDEFAILAVRTDSERAAELAERLVSEVLVASRPAPVSRPAVGWATFGEVASTSDELVLQASAALRGTRRRDARRGGAIRTRSAS